MIQMRRCIIFAVFLSVLFINLSTGQAFRCWFCNTETDPTCGDPFNTTVYHRHEECNPTSYYQGQGPTNVGVNRYVCRKVKYHRANNRNNDLAVSRMCVLDGEREADPCSQQSLSTYLRVEHCSTCDTDLCNSAPTLFKISSLFGPVIIFWSKMNIL